MVKPCKNLISQSQEIGNYEIAKNLAELSGLLEQQGANVFRVRAYRNAAGIVSNLKESISKILETDGVGGLQQIPGIGHSISHSIEQLVHDGKIPLLDRLRGDARPERILTTVTGIGSGLAKRIHEQLGIEKLVDLEAAVYNGRLATLPSFGKKRLRAVQESLASRSLRKAPRNFPQAKRDSPTVEEILDVDNEYRKKVEARELSFIAPKYFNPDQKAWLPVLHTQRGDHHYTALFSNTARAHELGKTHDWVVIHQDDPSGNGQWTVITSLFGILKGQRIIPGREVECRRYYDNCKKLIV